MFSAGNSNKNSWGQSTGFSGVNSNTSQGNSNPLGSLFGNSTTNSTSTGLFGSKPSTGSNLFGSNSTPNNGIGLGNNNTIGSTGTTGAATGGLGASTSTNSNSAQPYVTNSIFQGIPTNYEMPASITGDLFNNNDQSKSSSKSFFTTNDTANIGTKQSSLFSKIAGRLNIFRTNYGETMEKSNGIFSSNEFPSSKVVSVNGGKDNRNKITKPVKLGLIQSRSTNATKKLIIKSKPLKFHLINADKVLDSKKKRVITSLVSSDKLLNDVSDDEDSDFELSDSNLKADSINKSKIIKDASSGKFSTLNETKISKSSIREGSYWTSPSIDEISSWSLKDLSNIENFIIGRRGYGQIVFNSPVDLSDLKKKCLEQEKSLEDELFGEIVEIGMKFVKVYKDHENKPPRGFGMNVPSTITLEHIEPTGGSELSSFIMMLKLKPGMEFVTYDPIMFIWTFKVEHFSIWGLVDEHGNDITIDSNKERSLEEQEYETELKRQKLNYQTKDLPGNWGNPTHDSVLKIKKNLITNEIDNQLNLLDNSPSSRPLNQEIVLEDVSMEDDEVPVKENFEYLKQLVLVLPSNVDLLEIIQEKAYEPEFDDEEAAFSLIQPRANVAISDDWLVQLQLTNDINSPLAQYLSSPTIKIQDQGKLKLELIDALLFGKLNESTGSSKEVSTPLVDSENIKIDDVVEIPDKFDHIGNVSKVLDVLLSKSEFEKRSNSFSRVKMSHIEFSEFTSANLTPKVKDIFKLCSVLFDKIVVDSDDMVDDSKLADHLTSIKQKEIFMGWLKEYNEVSVKKLISEAKDDFEKVLIYLCAGDIKQAIICAMNSKNYHLSAILTFSDSNFDGIKKMAKFQLEEWEKNDFIPRNLKKVYKFIAGDIQESLKDIPWNLRLAYTVYYEDPSVKLVESLNKILDTLDESDATVKILKFYHIYKTQTVDQSLEYLKKCNLHVSIIWSILRFLNEGLDDNVTLEFGKFVETLGLWKESIFAYAHLFNDEVAEKSIKSVVNENIKIIKNDHTNIDEEPYLVNTLRVPQSLIYESVATTEMESAKDYWKACDAFLTAQTWDKAHDCIVENLGPSVIISQEKSEIKKLETILSRFPNHGNIIPIWSQGAGIFKQYLDLLPYIKAGRITSDKQELIEGIMDNIPLLKTDKSMKSRASISILCKDIGDLAISLNIDKLHQRINALPLGEDETGYFNARLELV